MFNYLWHCYIIIMGLCLDPPSMQLCVGCHWRHCFPGDCSGGQTRKETLLLEEYSCICCVWVRLLKINYYVIMDDDNIHTFIRYHKFILYTWILFQCYFQNWLQNVDYSLEGREHRDFPSPEIVFLPRISKGNSFGSCHNNIIIMAWPPGLLSQALSLTHCTGY